MNLQLMESNATNERIKRDTTWEAPIPKAN